MRCSEQPAAANPPKRRPWIRGTSKSCDDAEAAGHTPGRFPYIQNGGAPHSNPIQETFERSEKASTSLGQVLRLLCSDPSHFRSAKLAYSLMAASAGGAHPPT